MRLEVIPTGSALLLGGRGPVVRAVLPGGSGRVLLERVGVADARPHPVQAPALSTARSRTA